MTLTERLREIKFRYDILSLLPLDSITIELGVAEGGFSEAIIKNGLVRHHYAVDRYTGERNHDDGEYMTALKRLDKYRNQCTLIRAEFRVALHLFPDNYFDFVYVDGYAHTGQENGKTLTDWWPKVKPGGIFAGDDYSANFPLTVNAVNKFAEERGLKLHITDCEPGNDWASLHQSWLIEKP